MTNRILRRPEVESLMGWPESDVTAWLDARTPRNCDVA